MTRLSHHRSKCKADADGVAISLQAKRYRSVSDSSRGRRRLQTTDFGLQALEASDLDCEDCHLSMEGDVTEEVSPQGRQSCHGCHVDEKVEAKSDIKCLSCHIGDMGAIVPSDHRAGWVSGHGSRVNLRRDSCSQCHSNRFCVQCHNRRDKADRVFHRGVALISHPLEARADPAQCGKCHTASFCIRCHQNKRF